MSKEIDQHILQFYQPKKLLGSGAYGHVWRVVDKRNKRQYALKKIFDAFQNSTDAQRTYRQISILTQLDHPNIVKMFKVIRAKNNRDLYIVFQYMEADLHSLVGEGILQIMHLKFIAYQMLKAMKYLHSAQLIHRDLKPSNILINTQCQIKICDFGLARTLTCEQNEQMILSQQVATRWYRSPQMLLGSRNYSKPTDVWSIGCIIAELLIGKPIFPGNSTLDQLEKVIQFTGIPSKESIDSLHSDVAQNLINQLSLRKRNHKQYFKSSDPQLISLVQKMLQFNPTKRITIQQALKSKFMLEFIQKQDQNNLFCNKFVVPVVDDNIKLPLVQYRKIIYQDIERRYPEQNTAYKNNRSVGSFSKVKKISLDEKKLNPSMPKNELRRQKSLIKINKKGNSLQKMKKQSPYKAVIIERQLAKIIKRQQKQSVGLIKTKSYKQLKKKTSQNRPFYKLKK